MSTPVRSLPMCPVAGDPARLTPRQRGWLERVTALGPALAARAAVHDRDARFATDDIADLRAAGLMGLTVASRDGGQGASWGDYMIVTAEIGRYSGAAALSFSMHAAHGLWIYTVADALGLAPAARSAHRRRCRSHGRAIAEEGRLCAQAVSEAGSAAAGTAPFATVAQPVAGGWRIHGRKVFASMAGHADVYGVLCTELKAGQATGSRRDTLYLAVPANAPGLAVVGDWDPLGMRATVSRGLELKDVFVPDEALLLPEGAWAQGAQRFPHIFASLLPAYLGQAQAAYDFTVDYLLGRVPGMAPVQRRMYATKQAAVAQMRLTLESMRAQFAALAADARIDPDHDARMRLYAAQHSVMEGAHDIARLALRTCGGQAMMRQWPLERIFRDTRCGSLMLPLTAELCLDRLGHECLYPDGEADAQESID